MNGRPIHATYWVCVDCYTAHAGISEHERGEPYPTDPAPLSAIPAESVAEGWCVAHCTVEDMTAHLASAAV